jgi:alpha/beta superfamily hydrolase
MEDTSTKISFVSNGLKLFGTLYKAPNEKAAALLIAGGGNKHRDDGYYSAWQEVFVKAGISTLNFDFRGVGESEGNLDESNLNTRTDDARVALEFLKANTDTKNIFIVGTSMGGPIAIRIVDSFIKGLLLAVPAAYSKEADGMNFGPDFSEVIRIPESWGDSLEFDRLKQYSGNTFLLYGDKDEVVPKDIFLNYEEIVKLNGGRVVVLEDTNHRDWWKDEGKRGHCLAQMTDFILEHSSN